VKLVFKVTAIIEHADLGVKTIHIESPFGAGSFDVPLSEPVAIDDRFDLLNQDRNQDPMDSYIPTPSEFVSIVAHREIGEPQNINRLIEIARRVSKNVSDLKRYEKENHSNV
jgi:hypothetical protein